MFALSKQNWISGTLELRSKVRYGMTSRGVPIFRFVPYDKRISPMAVGCSQRDLTHNVHAIVEPVHTPQIIGLLQKGNLIKNLGKPTYDTEQELILVAYAYDNCKSMRSFPSYNEEPHSSQSPPTSPFAQPERLLLPGLTFHIDPPGCKDVDDSFTIYYDLEKNLWDISINIADVAELIQELSPLDDCARIRATSFYTPSGNAIYPMLPREISENIASLLPGDGIKNTLSLCFTFDSTQQTLGEQKWKLTQTQTTTSYTYDSAMAASSSKELQILSQCASIVSSKQKELSDSHDWVERMMIFYNKEAGKLLAKHGAGILRRHIESSSAALQDIQGIAGIPDFLMYEAAEYCLPNAEVTRHFGLDSEFYAYASSPIRRYADLVNQRAIKSIIKGKVPSICSQNLVNDLNYRQKQAKAFSRDLFFMTSLSYSKNNDSVYGIIIYTEPLKVKIWVPAWKRTITSKSLVPRTFSKGVYVVIQWYESREQSRWKDRIIFELETKQHHFSV